MYTNELHVLILYCWLLVIPHSEHNCIFLCKYKCRLAWIFASCLCGVEI